MLKELRIVYEDGTKYTKIVHHTKATIKPIRDKIRHCECGPFKYKVEKHHYLPVSIIRFGNKYMIYPARCFRNTRYTWTNWRRQSSDWTDWHTRYTWTDGSNWYDRALWWTNG